MSDCKEEGKEGGQSNKAGARLKWKIETAWSCHFAANRVMHVMDRGPLPECIRGMSGRFVWSIFDKRLDGALLQRRMDEGYADDITQAMLDAERAAAALLGDESSDRWAWESQHTWRATRGMFTAIVSECWIRRDIPSEYAFHLMDSSGSTIDHGTVPSLTKAIEVCTNRIVMSSAPVAKPRKRAAVPVGAPLFVRDPVVDAVLV